MPLRTDILQKTVAGGAPVLKFQFPVQWYHIRPNILAGIDMSALRIPTHEHNILSAWWYFWSSTFAQEEFETFM